MGAQGRLHGEEKEEEKKEEGEEIQKEERLKDEETKACHSSSSSLSSDIDSGAFSRLSTPDCSLKSSPSPFTSPSSSPSSPPLSPSVFPLSPSSSSPPLSPSSSSAFTPLIDSSPLVHLDRQQLVLLHSLSSLSPEDCTPCSSPSSHPITPQSCCSSSSSPPPPPSSSSSSSDTPSPPTASCSQVTVNGKCYHCCQ